MAQFTYSNSQRLHNSLISSLIQSIINPLLLFGGFALLILLIHRSIVLSLKNQFSLENSFSRESNITIVSVDFAIRNNEIDFSDVLNNEMYTHTENIQSLLEHDIHYTFEYLTLQYEQIVQTFNATLQTKLNASQQITSEQSNLQILIKSLNSSIIDTLSQDKTNIDNLKSELANAVYVGDSVDISNLSLNYDGIQQALQDVINRKYSTYDDSSIVELSDFKSDFLDELDELFQNTMEEIQNFDTNIQLNTTSYSFNLTPFLLNTNITSTNSTSNTSLGISPSEFSNFRKTSNINLITIGIFLFISYLLIMVYQYFKFRYHSNYTASRLIDLEKSEHKVDFLGIVQSTSEPTVTMITDIQTQLLKKWGNSDKLFWINSYLFSESANLPYMFMVIFTLLIIVLSFGKMKLFESISSDNSKNTSYRILKGYNLTQFDDVKVINFNTTIIDNYNSKVYSRFQNITDSLQNLFNKYNIPAVLSVSNPTLGHKNLTIPALHSLQSSSVLNDLNNLSFELTTKVNTSNFQTSTIISTVLNTITTISIHITKLALISTTIIFFLLISIGALYSFFI